MGPREAREAKDLEIKLREEGENPPPEARHRWRFYSPGRDWCRRGAGEPGAAKALGLLTPPMQNEVPRMGGQLFWGYGNPLKVCVTGPFQRDTCWPFWTSLILAC